VEGGGRKKEGLLRLLTNLGEKPKKDQSAAGKGSFGEERGFMGGEGELVGAVGEGNRGFLYCFGGSRFGKVTSSRGRGRRGLFFVFEVPRLEGRKEEKGKKNARRFWRRKGGARNHGRKKKKKVLEKRGHQNGKRDHYFLGKKNKTLLLRGGEK